MPRVACGAAMNQSSQWNHCYVEWDTHSHHNRCFSLSLGTLQLLVSRVNCSNEGAWGHKMKLYPFSPLWSPCRSLIIDTISVCDLNRRSHLIVDGVDPSPLNPMFYGTLLMTAQPEESKKRCIACQQLKAKIHSTSNWSHIALGKLKQ